MLRLIRIFVAIGLLLPAAALAHRSGPAVRTDGVAIQTLTHGPMQIVARYFSEIRALADGAVFQDPTFRKINNYISLQYVACLWGAVPGSLTDEESPFNECSHGYLSAAQALLLHMKTMRSINVTAESLFDRVSLEMLMNNTAAIICRYSDEPFNNADVMSPHWADIPSHTPSLLSFVVLAILLSCGIGAFCLFMRGSRYQTGTIE